MNKPTPSVGKFASNAISSIGRWFGTAVIVVIDLIMAFFLLLSFFKWATSPWESFLC